MKQNSQLFQFILVGLLLITGSILSFSRPWIGGFLTGFSLAILLLSVVGYRMASKAARRMEKHAMDLRSQDNDA